MSEQDKPRYACPHCGATVFSSAPDSYPVFEAVGDSLYFKRTELAEGDMTLCCEECGEDAPEEFVRAIE